MYALDEEDNVIQTTNDAISKTFNRMGIGLLLTAIVAYLTFSSGWYLKLIVGSYYPVLAITEILVVLLFSFMYRKLSPAMVTFLFYSYAILNGVTLSVIFALYTLENIFSAFLVSALLFIGLSVYGEKTKKDLTKLGNIFSVGLIVGIIVSIVNLFLHSSMLMIIIDWGMLLLFCGITAYDMNKIKYMQQYVECDEEKIYVYCAMQLYLDFINIFLRLLSITSRRRK